MSITPFTLYRTMRQSLKRLLGAGHRVDLIDAHYFYPDGVAAVWLAEEFGLPVVVTARGTDLNLIPQFSHPRRMIQRAASKADGLVTVCQALKNSLVEKFTSEFSDVHPHLVQQAVNEADALATWAGIPHLLLPALAEEKVRNARNWSLHQRTVFERSRLALAA